MGRRVRRQSDDGAAADRAADKSDAHVGADDYANRVAADAARDAFSHRDDFAESNGNAYRERADRDSCAGYADELADANQYVIAGRVRFTRADAISRRRRRGRGFV